MGRWAESRSDPYVFCTKAWQKWCDKNDCELFVLNEEVLPHSTMPVSWQRYYVFDLLEANEIGMQLTESMAMHPASSVSGFYFAHPDAKYFSVDKIDKDQLEDMASRRSISIKQLQKWLAPNLK